MPVQTRSHGRPAQSLTTKIREAITNPAPRKTAAPKKTAVKKTDGARVTKKSATTKHKRKTGIADKIEGVALKIEGALTGKPAVKVGKIFFGFIHFCVVMNFGRLIHPHLTIPPLFVVSNHR